MRQLVVSSDENFWESQRQAKAYRTPNVFSVECAPSYNIHSRKNRSRDPSQMKHANNLSPWCPICFSLSFRPMETSARVNHNPTLSLDRQDDYRSALQVCAEARKVMIGE